MKKFIIPIVIVLVLGFFYVYYTQTETQGETGSLVSQNAVAGNSRATIAVGAEIISLLEKLDRITLDTALFQQPTFQSLRDFSITLRPQPVGRPNPFAPIGNDSSAQTNRAVQTPNVSSQEQASLEDTASLPDEVVASDEESLPNEEGVSDIPVDGE